MAEKTDEEIINEVGLTSSDISEKDALEELSIKDDALVPVDQKKDSNAKSENKAIENEDKDDERNLASDKKEQNSDDIPVQKKQPKIQKILIGVAVFLFLIIAIGAILYFTGIFDPKPVEEVKQVVEKKAQPEIVFNEDEINKTQLNKKLTMLTKKEIMDKEEFEAQENKIKEEERLKKEAEEKAIEDKKKEEEAKLAAQFEKIEEEKRLLQEQQAEFAKLQEEAKKTFEDQKAQLQMALENKTIPATDTQDVTNEPKQEEITTNEEEQTLPKEQEPTMQNNNEFLSFINVATIKGELYKSYLDKVSKYGTNLSICRDPKNRIELYFGPFDSQKEREKVLDNLLENGFKQSYLVDFTKEEYKKRCEY